MDTPNNTQYECCVACISDPYCKVAEYSSLPATGYNQCLLDYGDHETSCADGLVVDIRISVQGGVGVDSSVSKGNCGGRVTFYYLPVDGSNVDPNAPTG